MATNTNEMQELKAELASLRSDMTDIGDTLAKLARSSASEGREKVKDAADYSRNQAKQAVGAFEKEVEERPMTSLAVALGLGFMLGKLIHR